MVFRTRVPEEKVQPCASGIHILPRQRQLRFSDRPHLGRHVRMTPEVVREVPTGDILLQRHPLLTPHLIVHPQSRDQLGHGACIEGDHLNAAAEDLALSPADLAQGPDESAEVPAERSVLHH